MPLREMTQRRGCLAIMKRTEHQNLTPTATVSIWPCPRQAVMRDGDSLERFVSNAGYWQFFGRRGFHPSGRIILDRPVLYPGSFWGGHNVSGSCALTSMQMKRRKRSYRYSAASLRYNVPYRCRWPARPQVHLGTDSWCANRILNRTRYARRLTRSDSLTGKAPPI
jgi:hypothetical protein